MVDAVQTLNADGEAAKIDRAALDAAIQAQGAAFQQSVSAGHEHLFAAVPLFIAPVQLQQMRDVIAAVEEVVASGKWLVDSGERSGELGVFYGYDFHLNAQGAHLIEINSNAGGAFLNALLVASTVSLPGIAVAADHLEQVFVAMFCNEWHLVRGDVPLQNIAIVDEQPQSQYLYPEFLLAQQMFERAGIAAHIVDPAALQARDGGLYCNGQRIDLVYNRLTDFDLQHYPQLRSAWEKRQVVLTPSPAHYRRYADKRKLALLTDGEWLRNAGVSQASIDALLRGIPQTLIVNSADAEQWWAERKQWFFKPASGYGSKGAYRGDKLTRRVFEGIMQADYVAQRLAQPGERQVCADGAEPQSLKYDVRCYVYDGQIQLAAARLYQGQTTNFRTPGGGFAAVRMLG